MARKSFNIEKFVLGLQQLEITDALKRMRRLFKVYDTCIDNSLYGCPEFLKQKEVPSCYSRKLRHSQTTRDATSRDCS